jgi:hypothetical protein
MIALTAAFWASVLAAVVWLAYHLAEVKVEGQKSWGRRSAMMLNSVDECRQRADECRRSAAQIATDDVLRGAYLDLDRLWRMMAHQAETLEQKTLRVKRTGQGRP